MTRPIKGKTTIRIAAEWDALAETRLNQIRSGVDRSFDLILKPAILQEVGQATSRSLLDVGCGSGSLSSALAARVRRLVGIDPSKVSIDLARRYHLSHNATYFEASVEEWAAQQPQQYDFVVANMVLMDVADLSAALAAMSKLCKTNGTIHATITHPFFWPKYWGYDSAPWFSYMAETHIEAPFRIAAADTELWTTHTHRPLERYLSSFSAAGFRAIRIKELIDPRPSVNASGQSYPRFMLISASRA
jgi:ubiquinone/menaquinone biosynthesis C-methylase UbiE